MPTLRVNKDAKFKYSLLEKYEAGLELYGWEVKAIKSGNIDFKGSYVKPIGNEFYWINGLITPVTRGESDYDPSRMRRLLLHRNEIAKLQLLIKAKGVTIVPVRLYTTRNLIKLEIATAKGKKHFEQK